MGKNFGNSNTFNMLPSENPQTEWYMNTMVVMMISETLKSAAMRRRVQLPSNIVEKLKKLSTEPILMAFTDEVNKIRESNTDKHGLHMTSMRPDKESELIATDETIKERKEGRARVSSSARKMIPKDLEELSIMTEFIKGAIDRVLENDGFITIYDAETLSRYIGIISQPAVQRMYIRDQQKEISRYEKEQERLATRKFNIKSDESISAESQERQKRNLQKNFYKENDRELYETAKENMEKRKNGDKDLVSLSRDIDNLTGYVKDESGRYPDIYYTARRILQHHGTDNILENLDGFKLSTQKVDPGFLKDLDYKQDPTTGARFLSSDGMFALSILMAGLKTIDQGQKAMLSGMDISLSPVEQQTLKDSLTHTSSVYKRADISGTAVSENYKKYVRSSLIEAKKNRNGLAGLTNRHFKLQGNWPEDIETEMQLETNVDDSLVKARDNYMQSYELYQTIKNTYSTPSFAISYDEDSMDSDNETYFPFRNDADVNLYPFRHFHPSKTLELIIQSDYVRARLEAIPVELLDTIDPKAAKLSQEVQKASWVKREIRRNAMNGGIRSDGTVTGRSSGILDFFSYSREDVEKIMRKAIEDVDMKFDDKGWFSGNDKMKGKPINRKRKELGEDIKGILFSACADEMETVGMAEGQEILEIELMQALDFLKSTNPNPISSVNIRSSMMNPATKEMTIGFPRLPVSGKNAKDIGVRGGVQALSASALLCALFNLPIDSNIDSALKPGEIAKYSAESRKNLVDDIATILNSAGGDKESVDSKAKKIWDKEFLMGLIYDVAYAIDHARNEINEAYKANYGKDFPTFTGPGKLTKALDKLQDSMKDLYISNFCDNFEACKNAFNAAYASDGIYRGDKDEDDPIPMFLEIFSEVGKTYNEKLMFAQAAEALERVAGMPERGEIEANDEEGHRIAEMAAKDAQILRQVGSGDDPEKTKFNLSQFGRKILSDITYAAISNTLAVMNREFEYTSHRNTELSSFNTFDDMSGKSDSTLGMFYKGTMLVQDTNSMNDIFTDILPYYKEALTLEEVGNEGNVLRGRLEKMMELDREKLLKENESSGVAEAPYSISVHKDLFEALVTELMDYDSYGDSYESCKNIISRMYDNAPDFMKTRKEDLYIKLDELHNMGADDPNVDFAALDIVEYMKKNNFDLFDDYTRYGDNRKMLSSDEVESREEAFADRHRAALEEKKCEYEYRQKFTPKEEMLATVAISNLYSRDNSMAMSFLRSDAVSAFLNSGRIDTQNMSVEDLMSEYKKQMLNVKMRVSFEFTNYLCDRYQLMGQNMNCTRMGQEETDRNNLDKISKPRRWSISSIDDEESLSKNGFEEPLSHFSLFRGDVTQVCASALSALKNDGSSKKATLLSKTVSEIPKDSIFRDICKNFPGISENHLADNFVEQFRKQNFTSYKQNRKDKQDSGMWNVTQLNIAHDEVKKGLEDPDPRKRMEAVGKGMELIDRFKAGDRQIRKGGIPAGNKDNSHSM